MSISTFGKDSLLVKAPVGVQVENPNSRIQGVFAPHLCHMGENSIFLTCKFTAGAAEKKKIQQSGHIQMNFGNISCTLWG